MSWAFVLTLSATAYAFKVLGLVVVGDRRLPAVVDRCLALIPAALVAARAEEQRRAATLLGVRDVRFLGGVDGELAWGRPLIGAIAREIRETPAHSGTPAIPAALAATDLHLGRQRQALRSMAKNLEELQQIELDSSEFDCSLAAKYFAGALIQRDVFKTQDAGFAVAWRVTTEQCSKASQ